MTTLTPEELAGLKALASLPLWGCARPGSNFLPMTCLQTPRGEVDGEIMDSLHRKGLLSAVHLPKDDPYTIGDGNYGPYGHIPAIDLDWDWSVNEAGRRTLSDQQKGGSDG